MKRILILSGSLLAAVIALIVLRNRTDKLSSEHTARASTTRLARFSQNESNSKGFALLELFTSEGCSSCPPADDLLGKIAQQAITENQPIYLLAFHVDYWNNLGWTDRFSSANYSDRQREYAETFQSSSVYTPQLVVNGTKEMVGSNAPRVNDAISAALAERPTTNLMLANSIATDRSVSFDYAIEGNNVDSCSLDIAVVEKSDESNVTKGENGGRLLKHANVVRAFTSMHPAAQGSANVTLPTNLTINAGNMDDYVVIAFLQEPHNGRIIAASEIGL